MLRSEKPSPLEVRNSGQQLPQREEDLNFAVHSHTKDSITVLPKRRRRKSNAEYLLRPVTLIVKKC